MRKLLFRFPYQSLTHFAELTLQKGCTSPSQSTPINACADSILLLQDKSCDSLPMTPCDALKTQTIPDCLWTDSKWRISLGEKKYCKSNNEDSPFNLPQAFAWGPYQAALMTAAPARRLHLLRLRLLRRQIPRACQRWSLPSV